MKRLLIPIIVLILVFALAGCRSADIYDNNETQLIETAPPAMADDDEDSQQEDNGYDAPASPHPLAIALKDFIAGAEDEIKAFLVDVDGNNTEGILAIDLSGFPMGTLLYIHDGILHQADVGPQDAGFVSSMTEGGRRLVNLMGDGGQRSYTLFGIEEGELVEALIIHVSMTGEYSGEYPDITWYHDYRYGGWDGEIITQEEFNNIRTRYGLDNVRGSWWDMEDESIEILQMVAE